MYHKQVKNGGQGWSRTSVVWASTRSKTVLRPVQNKLVGRDGFEPPTFRVSAEGSNRLSYLPMESERRIGLLLSRFCRPRPKPVLGTRPLVAEGGFEPPPSVSETEALPLCNSALLNGVGDGIRTHKTKRLFDYTTLSRMNAETLWTHRSDYLLSNSHKKWQAQVESNYSLRFWRPWHNHYTMYLL